MITTFNKLLSKMNLLIFQLSLLILFICLLGTTTQVHAEEEPVSPERFNVIVSYKNQNGFRRVLQDFKRQSFATREEQIDAFHTQLKGFCDKNHNDMIEKMAQYEGVTCESLWISNCVIVRNVNEDHVTFLRSLEDVAEVVKEKIFPLPKFKAAIVNKNLDDGSTEWGVKRVSAPDVWSMETTPGVGSKIGEGVIVGSIDTGVRVTHEALRDNYLKDGWFDPTTKTGNPTDDVGHGTHVMGTICGIGGIGVAPGATFIACKGCDITGCPESSLLSCGQWMTGPTNSQGIRNSSMTPRIINNSWGGGQGDTFYDDTINSWITLGIIPVFSIGNEGPSCGSASSPGDAPETLAVGATNQSDSITGFSSRGPTIEGFQKPDISAPGAEIRSAWFTSDSSYALLDGTSMASPHVTGCCALLLGADPTLTFDQIKSHLFNGTDKFGLVDNGNNCGNIQDNTFPNNVYGNGIVNVFKALQNAQETKKNESCADKNCAPAA